MNTYTYKIAALDTAKSVDGLVDVVVTAHYLVDCTDGTDFVGSYGSVSFEAPDAASFKPYSTLTESEVIGWVQAKLDVPTLEASLDAALALKKNPPIVQLPIPWVPVIESIAPTPDISVPSA